MTDDEDNAPGWHAIDAALEPLYGETKPSHWAPILHARIGGSDYIDGISAYRSDEYQPHWHFITYGFSELYEKESDDPQVSGFGFELTFRVARTNAPEPPAWALSLLQNLGRYVYQTGNALAPGHYMNLNSTIAVGVDTPLRAVTFTPDPQLSEPIATPNGSLQFLQVVGITLDELQAIKTWNAEKVLAAAAASLPGLVTDLSRRSLLENPAFQAAIDKGVHEEGSSTAIIHATNVQWRISRQWTGRLHVIVTVGANAVRDLASILPARIPFGQPFAIAGPQIVGFVPSEECTWEKRDSNDLCINISSAAALQLSELIQPRVGEYRAPSVPFLTVVVEQSLIRDADGNIVETIG